ncbi:MAG TPA: DUF4259 domain-containing protein [Kofleriaceae bacterium]
MGSWGNGAFDNDDAATFLDEAEHSPGAATTRALRLRPGYLDVDDGGAAWAACELVALASGHGETIDDRVLALAGRIKPTAALRKLAVTALSRIVDRDQSELAQLWGKGFAATIEKLRTRLSAKPRAIQAPKPGAIFALKHRRGFIAVQLVAPGEVAVFEGTCRALGDVRAAVKQRPARRVAASTRLGSPIGTAPLRKDLRVKKLYASETGSRDSFTLAPATGRGVRIATYDEARDFDLFEHHDVGMLCEVALGKREVARVRPPEDQWAEYRKDNAKAWAARRRKTQPGPFGDVEVLENLNAWFDECGVANGFERLHDEAMGMQGFGRPNEGDERATYARIALVALWRGTWPKRDWPKRVKLPAAPAKAVVAKAVKAARILVGEVLSADSELPMIWGDRLPPIVAKLAAALR